MRHALILLVCATLAYAADPAGTAASRAAQAACAHAGTLAADARPEAYRAALAQADAAVAADESDPLAHFAAFCALGGLLKTSGLGFSAPGQLRRLRREVDRTLELAPDFADALAGKGSLLCNLPRLLGGDTAEGERLLRRAIAIDPDYFTPRLTLAESLRGHGEVTEAREQAERALAIAERKGDADDARDARELLATLPHAATDP